MMIVMIGDHKDNDEEVAVHIDVRPYLQNLFIVNDFRHLEEKRIRFELLTTLIIVLADVNSRAYCFEKPLLLKMCSGCSSGEACPHSQKEMAAFFDHSSCDMSQYNQDICLTFTYLVILQAF